MKKISLKMLVAILMGISTFGMQVNAQGVYGYQMRSEVCGDNETRQVRCRPADDTCTVSNQTSCPEFGD